MKCGVRICEGSGRYGFQDQVELTDEEMAEGGYYCKLERFEPVKPSGAYGPYAVKRALVNAGIVPSHTLYAVPKSLWKKFEGDQWIEIYDAAEQWLDDNLDVDLVHTADAVSKGLQSHTLQFVAEKVDLSKLGDASDINDAVKFFNGLKEFDFAATGNMKSILEVMGRAHSALLRDEDAEDIQTQVELDFYNELLDETYPLIDVLARQCQYEDHLVDKVTDYVYMCDAAAESLRQTAAKAA